MKHHNLKMVLAAPIGLLVEVSPFLLKLLGLPKFSGCFLELALNCLSLCVAFVCL